MNKRELRKLLRESKLPEDYMKRAGMNIASKVIDTALFRNAGSVFCYVSTAEEPSTEIIINEALKTKRVYVPKCISDSEMLAVRIHSVEELETGHYGIPEPVDVSETSVSFDLMIVPCMAAGRNGERLGHGRGYYDRFLKKADGKIICLCFEDNISDDIDMDENDVFMPVVMTEKNEYGM
ncbi:MAG: 5-formyltetrahydrofolate cyclo-ligase [Erysipelotrichaceae bacterium]|nr:5-formyltetrahydrofolate cyclo-ligase [Erysipelotrichaceae bacterium]